MEKNKALGDKLQGEALKGTFDPPVKKDPPEPFEGNHAIHIDRSDRLWDPALDEISESEKRLLDGNR